MEVLFLLLLLIGSVCLLVSLKMGIEDLQTLLASVPILPPQQRDIYVWHLLKKNIIPPCPILYSQETLYIYFFERNIIL